MTTTTFLAASLPDFFPNPVGHPKTTPLLRTHTNIITECTGITYINEDSSEITFLLVENYQLTALFGPRIG